jgi:hypothetical protein
MLRKELIIIIFISLLLIDCFEIKNQMENNINGIRDRFEFK